MIVVVSQKNISRVLVFISFYHILSPLLRSGQCLNGVQDAAMDLSRISLDESHCLHPIWMDKPFVIFWHSLNTILFYFNIVVRRRQAYVDSYRCSIDMTVLEAPAQPCPDSCPETGSDSDASHKTVKGADGGYAWVIVGAILASFSVSWGEYSPHYWSKLEATLPADNRTGNNTTYGVYVSFLIQHDYIPGGTPLRYGFVGGLSIAVALLSAPLVNFLINKFGFRVPFIIGVADASQQN